MSWIEVTPAVDPKQQVTVGDRVRLRWLLDAQVNPDDIVLTVLGDSEATYSGNDLTEQKVEQDGETYWRYTRDVVLDSIRTDVEYALTDPVNQIVDTAFINAQADL